MWLSRVQNGLLQINAIIILPTFLHDTGIFVYLPTQLFSELQQVLIWQQTMFFCRM